MLQKSSTVVEVGKISDGIAQRDDADGSCVSAPMLGDPETWTSTRKDRLAELRRICGYVVISPLAVLAMTILFATPPGGLPAQGMQFVGRAFNPEKLAPFSYTMLGAAVTLNLATMLGERLDTLNTVEFAHVGVSLSGVINGMRIAASTSVFMAAASWLSWPRPAESVGLSIVMTICALATTALVAWITPNDALADTADHAAARREWLRRTEAKSMWEDKRLLNVTTTGETHLSDDAAKSLKRAAWQRGGRFGGTVIIGSAPLIFLGLVPLLISAITHPQSSETRSALAAMLLWSWTWSIAMVILLATINGTAVDIVQDAFRRRWLAVPVAVGIAESLLIAILVSTFPLTDGSDGTELQLSAAYQWVIGATLFTLGVALTLALVAWFRAALPPTGSARWERVVRGVSRAVWGFMWDSAALHILNRMNSLEQNRKVRGWPSFPSASRTQENR